LFRRGRASFAHAVPEGRTRPRDGFRTLWTRGRRGRLHAGERHPPPGLSASQAWLAPRADPNEDSLGLNARPLAGGSNRKMSVEFSLRCAALLFDLDGVLVDSAACIERIWHRWSVDHGLDLAALHVGLSDGALLEIRSVPA